MSGIEAFAVFQIVESVKQSVEIVDRLAIQHSNSDLITSCRKLRHAVMVVRSRDSWPSKREEYHHSHDHTPIFYVKGGAANFVNTRERIKQYGRIRIALVEGDAERNCITLMGSTAFLPIAHPDARTQNSLLCQAYNSWCKPRLQNSEFLQYLHATRSCTSLIGNTALLSTGKLPPYSHTEKPYTSLWKAALLPTEEVPHYIQIGKTYPSSTWELFDRTDGFLIDFNVWRNELCANQEGEKDDLQSSVYGAIATKKHWFVDNEARWQDTSTHAKPNIDHRQILCSCRNPALQSNHRRNRICINLCAVPGLVVSSYVLSRYIVQTSLSTMKGTILHRNLTGFPVIDHPSSTTFVFVVLMYGICSMSMYRANSHHFYQQHTICLSIICVVIFQLFRYPSLNEALGMAAAVIPAGVTIALVVSVVLHFWSPSYEEVLFQDLIQKVEKMVYKGEMDLL
ncbi:uncharacterized protein EAE98_003919 [Botrytis deweyae]|uniref:Uncharacterized protein n=1 Tax=Botrytis deweyae TaxID=2478750 RepID=A0ABQ7IS47_9HELO|nr:uncharacterized protein EAE98_003919 [Botrytis deweyae]KAF7932620.1 hypothetical protein EAE98_003919 [Botrytis deweyae]